LKKRALGFVLLKNLILNSLFLLKTPGNYNKHLDKPIYNFKQPKNPQKKQKSTQNQKHS